MTLSAHENVDWKFSENVCESTARVHVVMYSIIYQLSGIYMYAEMIADSDKSPAVFFCCDHDTLQSTSVRTIMGRIKFIWTIVD